MSKRKVIVVGAGPAGMMAAGQAAERGAEALLLEKMDRPGRKLSLTGKGRCNLTNVAPIEDFVSHFGPNGRFLRGAFARFFTSDLLAFMEKLGVRTVTERGGRVFPQRGEATVVVDALMRWLADLGVRIQTRSPVERLRIEGNRVVGVELAGGAAAAGKAPSQGDALPGLLRSDAVIIATGGASYPSSGSTGDGYRMAAEAGHTIVPIRPALVPLETAGDTASALQRLKLRHVEVTVLIDGKRQAQAFGEMQFTHFGVSGPIILTLSRQAVDALRANRKVSLAIDLKPALDQAKLEARLLRDLDSLGKKNFRTLLKGLLPKKLIPVCLQAVEIPAEKPVHQITADERTRLRIWLKDFRLEVTGHRSFKTAIITAGGVATKEIDPRSMASRLVEGLYFAGEVIDVDADTGGYNLQAAFSTGWMAGRAAAG
jgi:hypothetical protein